MTANIPIWVTDPAGNNNPYLKIVPKGSLVIGSVGQQFGPGDYYTSVDGINWTATIGGLSVQGANNGDGVAQAFAGNGINFILGFVGSGSYGGVANKKMQFLISNNGGTSFSLSSMSAFGDGAHQPILGTLFNYYDPNPSSGQPGFRLAIQNLALTQVTYMSSYDGGNTWTTDQTLNSPQSGNAPAFWGLQSQQNYVKGIFNGSNFYVSRIRVAGTSQIYGGTTVPTPPINSVPAGWSLLFSQVNGGSGFSDGTFQLGVLPSGAANTTFVINDSIKTSPMLAAGTGSAATWQEITLSGSLGVNSGISSDTTTWEFT